METLEERRHRMDMAQKIVTGKQRSRLEVRRNFFSQRVVDGWNNIPSVIKDTNTLTSFKRLYGAHREKVGTAA